MSIYFLFFSIILNVMYFIECYKRPLIVNGSKAKISQFPHSIFISIQCKSAGGKLLEAWSCGGSIVNEKIALTAAHCLDVCYHRTPSVVLYVGHAVAHKGKASTAFNYLLHEKYDKQTMHADIALVNLKTRLKFNKKVKRVALLRKPPYTEPAELAGWGLIDEISKIGTDQLMYIQQKVWKIEKCKALLLRLPEGTICASNKNKHKYGSSGDSGSALMVRGYIQIGIVSFKWLHISRSVVVYTDTGFYYKWIRYTSKRLYCTGP